MKKSASLVVCILLAAVLSGGVSLGASSWETDFEEASATAKASNKYMLLDFSGSDWCGWCVKLDNEVFRKNSFLLEILDWKMSQDRTKPPKPTTHDHVRYQ